MSAACCSPPARASLLAVFDRGPLRALNAVSVAAVAVGAGMVAGGAALFGFGFDSLTESTSGGPLL